MSRFGTKGEAPRRSLPLARFLLVAVAGVLGAYLGGTSAEFWADNMETYMPTLPALSPGEIQASKVLSAVLTGVPVAWVSNKVLKKVLP